MLAEAPVVCALIPLQQLLSASAPSCYLLICSNPGITGLALPGLYFTGLSSVGTEAQVKIPDVLAPVTQRAATGDPFLHPF